MLHASTLGYEIATPTELPRVRPVHHRPHPNLPHGEEKKPKRCPYSNLLQGTERNHNPLKHSENEFPPLGEGWGGAYNQLFFYRQRRTFGTPKARFFTVAAVVAMQRMALGMVATTRRKTRFPHGVTTVTKKAKPTTAAMAFCIYINH